MNNLFLDTKIEKNNKELIKINQNLFEESSKISNDYIENNNTFLNNEKIFKNIEEKYISIKKKYDKLKKVLEYNNQNNSDFLIAINNLEKVIKILEHNKSFLEKIKNIDEYLNKEKHLIALNIYYQIKNIKEDNNLWIKIKEIFKNFEINFKEKIKNYLLKIIKNLIISLNNREKSILNKIENFHLKELFDFSKTSVLLNSLINKQGSYISVNNFKINMIHEKNITQTILTITNKLNINDEIMTLLNNNLNKYIKKIFKDNKKINYKNSINKTFVKIILIKNFKTILKNELNFELNLLSFTNIFKSVYNLFQEKINNDKFSEKDLNFLGNEIIILIEKLDDFEIYKEDIKFLFSIFKILFEKYYKNVKSLYISSFENNLNNEKENLLKEYFVDKFYKINILENIGINNIISNEENDAYLLLNKSFKGVFLNKKCLSIIFLINSYDFYEKIDLFLDKFNDFEFIYEDIFLLKDNFIDKYVTKLFKSLFKYIENNINFNDYKNYFVLFDSLIEIQDYLNLYIQKKVKSVYMYKYSKYLNDISSKYHEKFYENIISLIDLNLKKFNTLHFGKNKKIDYVYILDNLNTLIADMFKNIKEDNLLIFFCSKLNIEMFNKINNLFKNCSKYSLIDIYLLNNNLKELINFVYNIASQELKDLFIIIFEVTKFFDILLSGNLDTLFFIKSKNPFKYLKIENIIKILSKYNRENCNGIVKLHKKEIKKLIEILK